MLWAVHWSIKSLLPNPRVHISLPQEYLGSCHLWIISATTSLSPPNSIKKNADYSAGTASYSILKIGRGGSFAVVWWHLSDVQHLSSPWSVSPLALPGLPGVRLGSLLVLAATIWSFSCRCPVWLASSLVCMVPVLGLLFLFLCSDIMCTVALWAFFD